jgi:hypothetical protein
VWGIFSKVFRRSCGPPTRSVGPTERSVGLLVGRTHFSGTAVSLVGGDPGGTHVSQTNLSEVQNKSYKNIGSITLCNFGTEARHDITQHIQN